MIGIRHKLSIRASWLWGAVALLLAGRSGAAFAENAGGSPLPDPPAAVATSPGAADDFLTQRKLAELLVVQNRFDDARVKLVALEKMRPRDEQVQFLLGLLDMQAKDYEAAIGHFHRVLVSQPKAVRVRLELGRAYFESGDYFDADRQFQFARAGKSPPAVLANIDRYINAIRELKTLSFGLSVGVASDSNLNAGPAVDSVSLYGLPFTLSQTARANSGFGLAFDANVEWSPRVVKHFKWRTGVVLHRSQYGQTLFDDMTLTGYTGPHITLKRWDINLLGNVSRRWYGDRLYTNSHGASVDATYYVTTRLGLSASGALSHVNYALNPLQSGNGRSLTLGAFYTPTPASFVRVTASFASQGARVPSLADNARQYGLSYSREFKGGISVSLSPTYSRIAYQGFSPGFNNTRRDHQLSGQIGLLDRRFDWYGFTPRVLYTYTRNDSNIPLFSFSRNRFEVGVTRSF